MPRLDRLVTLWGNLWFCGKRQPSILMYHDVSDSDESHRHPYYRVSTRPERFREQMEFLKKEGYISCTPEQLVTGDSVNSKPQEVVKRVAITFDDGFKSVYTQALPILEEYGFTATVYLPSSLITATGGHFQGKPLLSWGEVKDMAKRGIRFGSHTVTHPELITLSKKDVAYELEKSKLVIEQEAGVSVTSFAFPFAYPEINKKFTEYCRGILQNAGYTNAVTTVVGTVNVADDPFSLKRLPVNNDDDVSLLKAKLRGAYNWIRLFQVMVKAVKTRSSKICSEDFR